MAKADSSLVDAVVLAGAPEARHIGDGGLWNYPHPGQSVRRCADHRTIAVASDSIARANIADQKEASTGTARTFRGVAPLAPGSV